ncbi:Catalase [Acidisarcina polymorpha]|uniref:Catalase n=1 Tax=Acidisarcina polymorpha TaxID=2211140 RepID=A0A2Z5FXT9_9BACT|nr:catalase-related domain-containing protein [Acidisarcina polymorpha]AXC11186.1 Catalase [Acidisarcina polymorpha]
MRTDGNLGGTISYNPNSYGTWDNQPKYADPALELHGDADHWDHYLDDDHYEKPGNLFRKMTPAQQQVLFENTTRAISGASEEVLLRHMKNCTKADSAHGEGVSRALGLNVTTQV